MEKDKLLKLKNVIGYSEHDDAWNDKDTVTVFVKKKLKMSTINKKIKDPKSSWTEKDVIPGEVKVGLFKKKKTDVIEIGDVKIETADRATYRPIKGGCEISPVSSSTVGTAGAIIKFYEYNNLKLLGGWGSFVKLLRYFGVEPIQKYGILTNAHVTQLSVLDLKTEHKIVQPGARSSTYAIGKVVFNLPIDKDSTNEYDVSLVEIDPNREVLEEIIEVGTIDGFKEVAVNDVVHKYGRTTRYTEGICVARNVRISINYGNDGTLSFTNLDMYTNMSAGGDSGSLIVSKDDNKAVSLLFAGSNTTTFGIPISKIVSKVTFDF